MKATAAGAVACVATVVLVCGAAVRAHEIGTTRVSVLDGHSESVSIELLAKAFGQE